MKDKWMIVYLDWQHDFVNWETVSKILWQWSKKLDNNIQWVLHGQNRHICGVWGQRWEEEEIVLSQKRPLSRNKSFLIFCLFGVRLPFTYSGSKYGQELLAAKHEHELELQLLGPLVSRCCWPRMKPDWWPGQLVWQVVYPEGIGKGQVTLVSSHYLTGQLGTS